MTDSEPRRVNYGHLRDYVNREVRFIGRIIAVDGSSSIRLESPEGHELNLLIHPGTQPKCKYIEVFCKVMPNMTLQQIGPLVEMGNELDMNIVNEAINLTFHPELAEYFESVDVKNTHEN